MFVKQLFEIDCDPQCGFMVRSHDKSETVEAAMKHVKDAHGKEVSQEDTEKMVKSV